MLFSSISFLYYFLPLTLMLYFAAPKELKNTVLLLASLLFYSWGEPKYVLLMGVSVLFGYGFGLLVEKIGKKEPERYFVYFRSASVCLFCCALNMQIFFLKTLMP